MEKEVARTLVDALEDHPHVAEIDRGKFYGILLEMDVPESGRFYEEVPERTDASELDMTPSHVSFDDGSSMDVVMRTVTMRRILRCDQAAHYDYAGLKKAGAIALAALGVYSSDVLTRTIRAKPDLVDLLEASENPYALLAKMETVEAGEPGVERHTTRPILIIPGEQRNPAVLAWEKAHTIYEIAEGSFRFRKRVSERRFHNYSTLSWAQRRLPDWAAVKVPSYMANALGLLDEQELQMKRLVERGMRLTRWIGSPQVYAETRSRHASDVMQELRSALGSYHGTHEKYFAAQLAEIKSRDRVALGYA